jgi:predicted nucleic-acid-binding protein
MRAVDTNILVRLFTGDDERQVALAEQYIEHGAWISHVALAETMWVLRSIFRLDHDEIATAIEMLLHEMTVTVHDADVVEAALHHYRRRPSLGFTDCLLLEIARNAGHLPLGTFDRDLSQLPGAERL